MYSLLIADDEELVRRGLAETFDWESLGFRVTGTAKDGAEALNILGRDGADVVLADIRMPNLNGLDMAARIRIQSPKTRVVILSGYDDFEYARNAIEQDVFSYLLKPLKEERAAEVFKQLKKTLDLEKEDSTDRHKGKTIRLQDILRRIFNTGEGSEEISAILEQPYSGGTVMMLDPCIHKSNITENNPYRILPRFLESLNGLSENIVATSLNENRIAILLISPLTELKNSVERTYQEIRRRGQEYGGMNFTAAVGNPAEHIQDIARSGSEARALLGHALYLGKNRLIEGKDIQREHALKLPDFQREAGRFTDIMTSRDETALIARSDRIFSLMREACPRNTTPLRTWFRNFFYSLNLVLTERGFASEAVLGNIDNIIDALAMARTIEDMRDIFYNKALSGLEETSKNTDKSGHRVVRYTIEALQTRFSEDVGLDVIADELNISSPYLSRLFKAETGVNFKEYLTRLRLDKARKMLRETGLKVYEIADATGYPDQKYFSELFKKRTGMAPREYRMEVRPPG